MRIEHTCEQATFMPASNYFENMVMSMLISIPAYTLD